MAYFVDWVCLVLPFGKKRTPTGCYSDAFNRTEEDVPNKDVEAKYGPIAQLARAHD